MEETFRHELKLTEIFIEKILDADPDGKHIRIIGKKDLKTAAL